MIRLFLQFYSGMILALLAAGIFILWLLNKPIGQIDGRELTTRLIYAAHFVANRIRRTPESDWQAAVTKYTENFDDLSIQWRPLDDPELSELQRKQLQWGRPVIAKSDNGEVQVLLSITNTETVLGVRQRKPLDDPYPQEIIMAGGGALAIVAVIGLILVVNIVGRLNGLEWASKEFGRGNWAVRANDTQVDAIGNLARSINKMAEQIESLIEEKNRLIQEQRELFQAVAHEFRAPMSRLSFATQLLADAHSGERTPALHCDVEKSLHALNNLVSEVLNYTRLQPGTPILKTKPVDLQVIVHTIVQQFRQQHQSLAFEIAESINHSVIVYVDPFYFRRALVNLINNAVNHASHVIRIHWQQSGSWFTVMVEDDGSGIPNEKRSHIFKPFTRLDPSRSRDSGGMGLGLAIVNRISQKHSGKVFVDRSRLGGARFRLHWPLNFTVSC